MHGLQIRANGVETLIKDKATGNVCTSGEATVMNVDKI